MLKFIKSAVKKLPGVSGLIADRDALRLQYEDAAWHRDNLLSACNVLQEELDETTSQPNAVIQDLKETKAKLTDLEKKLGFEPPGHYYSPIPSFEEIRKDEKRIFADVPQTIPGVELNNDTQLKLLSRFKSYYRDMPFQAEKQADLRYYYDNPAYSYSDGIFLHCMIRELKPRRIIEVGSGFSSCMIMDTNELFFDGSIATTFIEPHPELLMSLLTDADKSRTKTIPCRLQDVDLDEFESLQANDILFIDSTHVSKIDSDVNRIMFDILPRLASGVYIHFHDICFPFEYPKEWVLEGRAWNEAYLLKAFLQFNNSFEVVLMSTYLAKFHAPFLRENLPLCLENPGGSIWIRKT